MFSGRYHHPITFLSSLFIILLLSTSAGRADEWKCPVCATNAASGLSYLATLNKEETYNTFCKMHYESSWFSRIDGYNWFHCQKAIATVKEHLQDIVGGKTHFVNLKTLDAINTALVSADDAPLISLLTKGVVIPDRKAADEFKKYAQELKTLTQANWLVLRTIGEDSDCEEYPATYDEEDRYSSPYMEKQRQLIHDSLKCDVVSGDKLSFAYMLSNQYIRYAGLPNPISARYLTKLSDNMNRKIATLLTSQALTPDQDETREISLEILRYAKKLMFAQRYSDGNNRTALISMNMLNLIAGLPPFQSGQLPNISKGVQVEKMLDDYLNRGNIPYYLKEKLNRFYQHWYPQE